MSPTSPLSHKTWEVEEGFEEWEQKKKEKKKKGGKKERKKNKRIGAKNVEGGGGANKKEGEERKEKKGRRRRRVFSILMRLSSSALTKVLSWYFVSMFSTHGSGFERRKMVFGCLSCKLHSVESECC